MSPSPIAPPPRLTAAFRFLFPVEVSCSHPPLTPQAPVRPPLALLPTPPHPHGFPPPPHEPPSDPAPPPPFAWRTPSRSLAFYAHFRDPLSPPHSPSDLLFRLFDGGLDLGQSVVLEWFRIWVAPDPLAIITFPSIISLHDSLIR
jgi:hypothetical protein